MKIPYEKPMLAIERYALTQSIASCATKIGFNDAACVLKDEDATSGMKRMAKNHYFATSNDCKKVPSGNDQWDGICYHTQNNAAFNS